MPGSDFRSIKFSIRAEGNKADEVHASTIFVTLGCDMRMEGEELWLSFSRLSSRWENYVWYISSIFVAETMIEHCDAANQSDGEFVLGNDLGKDYKSFSKTPSC